MAVKNLADFGIDVPADASGDVKTTCPQCSASRQKSTAPCLSVNVEEGVWNCWHCGWTGSLKAGAEKQERKPRRTVKPKWDESVTSLPAKVLEYFSGRGITPEVLAANKVGYGPAWMPGPNAEVTCIQFPYLKGGEVVNVKYRDGHKNFRQAKDAEKCLYRFDEIASRANKERTLYITEGEMDALTLCVCGINSCTSVPDGAPSPETKQYEKKFSFLESAEELISAYGKVVLCVDNDLPGQTLERELSRRIGVERCWRVAYPDGCKDINEVLVKHGAQAVSEVLSNATPMPVEGLFSVADLTADVKLLYTEGLRPGVSTGWATLDPFYTVRPGEMTIVTGIPGSGKSNWLDALLVNLRYEHDWPFAIFSPENWPLERHVANLLEKIVRKPFSSRYSQAERMTPNDVQDGMDFMDGFFNFIMPPEDSMSLDSILQKSRAAIYRHGCKGVVIDPWNEIEHNRPERMSETDYTSQALTKIRRFARMNSVHVWLVAHPTKLQKSKDTGEYPVPTMYDISGCYSDDTEVLTKRGWIKHSEISLQDYVACFDAEDSTVSYMNPSRVIKKDYSGEMLNFKGYGYDLFVTPDHRMVVKPQWNEPNGKQAETGMGRPVKFKKGQWSFCLAEELPSSSFSLPLSAINKGRKAFIGEGLARLAGWYVSEGCVQGSGVAISQADGEKSESITKLLDSMGILYSTYRNNPGGKGGTKTINSFYIGARKNKWLVEWLKSECGVRSELQRIPKSVLDSCAEIKESFLETYLQGDGSIGRADSYRATTTSPRLRDDLQRLCAEIGRSCCWTPRIQKSDKHNLSWQVNIGGRHRTETSIRTGRNKFIGHYKGPVWCLTVPTGAYFVRRNGKMCVCGNSAHWRNKADNGICVHRPDYENDITEIYIQKIRFREIGKIGKIELKYNRDCGLYFE